MLTRALAAGVLLATLVSPFDRRHAGPLTTGERQRLSRT
jgi:hypothetical protein